jgi:hypothetical protein
MELKTELNLAPRRTPSPSPRQQLMGMIHGYWSSQICGTTARLGIADKLEDGWVVPRRRMPILRHTAAE